MKSEQKNETWKERYGPLLGKISDQEIAARAGISSGTVKKWRLDNGIHFERPDRPWTREDEQLLGKYTDREVSRLLLREIGEVTEQRRSLGLPLSTLPT